MRKHLHKFETTMWLLVKIALYVSLMYTFIYVLGRESIGLTRLSRTLGVTVLTFAVVGVLFLMVYGQYDVGRRKSKPIIYSLALAVACTDVVTYVQLMIMRTNRPTVYGFRFLSVGLLCVAFLLQTVIIIGFTYFGNWLFFKIHEPEKCCVITSSQRSLDVIVFAMEHLRKQYQVSEVLDYRRPDLREYIRDAETVFVYDVPVDVRTEIMCWCYRYKVNIYFNPEIEDIVELNAKQYVIDDVYLFNRNVKGLTMEQRVVKRLMDIVFSLVFGILSSPVWLVSMIAIKMEDGGPVFFTQKRATIHGRAFDVYKLRTMKPNDDNHSVTTEDGRITKVGAFLRRTRIDEIPQLLNVLKGDMTLVGPRPEMIKNVEEYTEELPEFKYRLRVKAGLTGYAQITGKYNTTPKDKLVMDMMYIEQFSILKDIQLIFQTAIALLKKDSTEAFGRKHKHCEYRFRKWDGETKEAK